MRTEVRSLTHGSTISIGQVQISSHIGSKICAFCNISCCMSTAEFRYHGYGWSSSWSKYGLARLLSWLKDFPFLPNQSVKQWSSVMIVHLGPVRSLEEAVEQRTSLRLMPNRLHQNLWGCDGGYVCSTSSLVFLVEVKSENHSLLP